MQWTCPASVPGNGDESSRRRSSSVTEWQQYDDEAKLTTKTILKYAWGKDGALDVTGNMKPASGVGDELQLDADDLLGHHILVFP
jgi:short subunit dehydrogenase-like uncharacterized protein